MSKGQVLGGLEMKRILLFFTICFILFIIYYDVSVGTLPTAVPAAPSKTTDSVPAATVSLPFTETTIVPGDTLLSIVENKQGGIPVSIEQVVTDFEKLNGIKPESMQIGKRYKIPVYK
jgi:hypothetical protein